jgi:hypothetical protein
MVSYISCSWCHTLNPTTLEHCPVCGHDVGKPRVACCCARCVFASGVALMGPLDFFGQEILKIEGDQPDFSGGSDAR